MACIEAKPRGAAVMGRSRGLICTEAESWNAKVRSREMACIEAKPRNGMNWGEAEEWTDMNWPEAED